MAKAAYVLSFLSWSREGYYEDGWERETTKRSKTPNTYQVTIYISPLDIKLVLHRSRCEYLVEGSSPPWARLPLVFSG